MFTSGNLHQCLCFNNCLIKPPGFKFYHNHSSHNDPFCFLVKCYCGNNNCGLDFICRFNEPRFFPITALVLITFYLSLFLYRLLIYVKRALVSSCYLLVKVIETNWNRYCYVRDIETICYMYCCSWLCLKLLGMTNLYFFSPHKPIFLSCSF